MVSGKVIVLPVDAMLNLDNKESFSSTTGCVARLLDTSSTVVDAAKAHKIIRSQFQYYAENELVCVWGKAKKG